MRLPLTFRSAILAAALISVPIWLSSCEGTIEPPGADAGAAGCEQPFTLRPLEATLGPDQVLVLSATGGSGSYRFSIETNESGGRISDTSGAYLSGLVAGTDNIEARDTECGGSANAIITITPRLVLEPQTMRVEPGDSLAMQATGGSGNFAFEILTSRSGASVTETGQYTAGSSLGIDVIRATDNVTGAVSQSTITVVDDASLKLPVEHIFLPEGSTYQIELDAAATLDLSTATPELLELTDGVIRGVGPGRTEVLATERFSGRTASMKVSIISPRSVAGDRTDEFSDRTSFGVSDDYTGDGIPDVLYAAPLASTGGYLAGAVFQYELGEGGLGTMPTRSWVGSSRDERFGSSLLTVDLDGDGRREVLIGSPRADVISTNNGAVYFYKVEEDGQLGDEPYQYIFGTGGFDQFGQSMTACDFNADGELDIAVGSITDETGRYSPLGRDQGAVHIFLGRGEGEIRVTPDISVYGEVASDPDDDGEREWLAVPGMNLGRELAAGDFDGDGACDLVAHGRRPGAEGGDIGIVLLYRGVPAFEGERGGIEEHAALRISGVLEGTPNGQLGRFLDLADIDGDGKDDLALSHHAAPVLGDATTGMAYIIPGQRLSAEPAYEDSLPADLASATFLGPERAAEFSRGLDLGDFNGDGRVDLAIGAPRAGQPDSDITRAGGVMVYLSGDLGLPPEPSHTIWNTERDQRFGHAVQSVGALGLGSGESLMAISGYTYDQGVRIPAPHLLNIRSNTPGDALSTPGVGAGAEFGRTTIFPGDINGDGFEDMIVGAHREARISWNGRRGSSHVYLGTAEGFPAEPSTQLGDFPHHGGDFGIRMSPAGDFNGDGFPDFAILAPNVNRPNITDTENYLVADDCTSNPGRGVVHIFLGTASGTPADRPAFMLVGPDTGRGRIAHILAGVDTDGDNLDDVIVSSQDWRNSPEPSDPPPMDPVVEYGGFAVYRGNLPDPSGRIVVLCEPNHIEFGPERDTEFGNALAPLGDLDADGCDDFAVGDPSYDLPLAEDVFRSNIGRVTVYFGFDGPTCNERTPRSVSFIGPATNGAAGSRLAGGRDLDGDGLNELLVGSFRFRDSEGERGRIYLMKGSYIRQAALGPTENLPIVDPLSSERLLLAGQNPGTDFGLGLSLLPNLGFESGPGIAVGARRSRLGEASLSGGVFIYRYTAAGLESDPVAVIAGDESATDSFLGEWLTVSDTETPVMSVASRFSNALYPGVGATYVFPLIP